MFKEKIILDLQPEQIHCVAQAIYAEAGGESFEGKQAVGHVILNRAKRSGKEPCIIIKQPGQFKFRTGIGKSWTEALRAARSLKTDITSGSLYFKALYAKVKWRYIPTITIGGHHFYK